eukprot:CAMPEP_0170484102 /NCGR_PEP_ID=MMETSP0208-20121228/3650_1 /TAXON_ID=197538 /ORGANISM="Strombidium inclinatum, Strain S3" /LENGTH=88 /DNA_ID=CAMNT_0010757361 /DNA_START=133 /DNA_END=396 /DNA_ORIENTATION=-
MKSRVFYLYSELKESSSSDTSSTTKPRPFSISDLLTNPPREQSIFTTSEEVALCSSMDQVSRVIDRLRPSSSSSHQEPLFVQINFIRV